METPVSDCTLLSRAGSYARRSRRLCLPLVLAALLACASAPSGQAPAQAALALQPLMGTWWVIGHVPYFTERGQVWAHDEYTLLADGRIGVHYTYRTGFHGPVKSLEAIAKPIPGSGNRDWRLRFFKVVPATQRIVAVAPDGSWMLAVSPKHDLAWVFARRPEMDGATYQGLLRQLRHAGVDSDLLWRVPQTPEQVGALGFERPNDD